MMRITLFILSAFAVLVNASGAWAGGGEKASLPQLDPSFYVGQAFWLLVTFPLLYLVVRYAISPRFQDVQDRRKTIIETDLSIAKMESQRAHQIKENMDSAYLKAREESQSMISQILTTAMGESVKRQEAQKAILDVQIREAESSIEMAKKNVLSQLAYSVDDVTKAIIQRVVGSSVHVRGQN